MGKIKQVTVQMPELGEGIIEVTIIKPLVDVGDDIQEDDSIFEVSTDKVDTEIPSPKSGKVIEVLFTENKIVKIGEPVLVLEIENNDEKDASTLSDVSIKSQNGFSDDSNLDFYSTKEILDQNLNKANQQINYSSSDVFLSPLVKKICQIEKINLSELTSIKGSGQNNRITKDDILNYLNNRKSNQNISNSILEKNTEKSQLEEKIEMSRTRKLISDRMVHSVKTSPHATSFIETDMTKIVLWRNKNKSDFLAENGVKLTYLPILVKIVANALVKYPMVNISTDGETIIKKNYINIGIATALESGELIVPVVRNANQLTVKEIALEIKLLVENARKGGLNPNQVMSGTYTISNIGTFGNLFGTPIINQPQSAILAIGSIVKKPAVIETEQGDVIGIRHKMFLSHSFDHRAIDGFLGGSFIKFISDQIESFKNIQGL